MYTKKITNILKDKVNGIYGTVSDLASVNKKYALALNVAARHKRNYIVVENDKTAFECIKLLKQMKLGFATFLPINKIKSISTDPNINKLVKQKGVHGLAIDLISFDNKFKAIFDNVLSNTLIVDSIEIIKQIGIGKFKIVSLDGDIADITGTICGGFRSKRVQSIGFSGKTNDIKRCD